MNSCFGSEYYKIQITRPNLSRALADQDVLWVMFIFLFESNVIGIIRKDTESVVDIYRFSL